MPIIFLELDRVRGELLGQPGASYSAALTSCPEYAEFSPDEQQALDMVCSGEATMCGIRHGDAVLIAKHQPAAAEWRGLRPGYLLWRLKSFAPPPRPARRGWRWAAVVLAMTAVGCAGAWGVVQRNAFVAATPGEQPRAAAASTPAFPTPMPAPQPTANAFQPEIDRLNKKIGLQEGVIAKQREWIKNHSKFHIDNPPPETNTEP